jgi:putative membrane protein
MYRKLLFAAALVVSSAALGAPAAKFLSEAAQGDNSEIQLGQLISERGSSASVRDFGKTLVSDHTQALAQVTSVAHEINVRIPKSIMPQARAERAKLEHLRGAAFDREVKRYMIHDHEKDISKFEMQARSSDRRTAKLAQQQLPTLKKHLHIAESLHG